MTVGADVLFCVSACVPSGMWRKGHVLGLDRRAVAMVVLVFVIRILVLARMSTTAAGAEPDGLAADSVMCPRNLAKL